jgi:hypothetical protein
MSFLNRRVGFDVSYTTIKTSTKLQLFHYLLQLDTAQALLNAGTIENKGIESTI